MNKYQFTYTIRYETQAVDEDDAIEHFADLIESDWMNYLDEGEILILEEESK